MAGMSGEAFRLLVVGRFAGVTRERLAVLAAEAGGVLLTRARAAPTVVALTSASAPRVLAEAPPLRLPPGIPPGVRFVSERGLRRLLGLAPPPADVPRTLTHAEVARSARLPGQTVDILALYDVLDPVDDHYGYADLLAAREAGRALAAGLDLPRVVAAAAKLARSGASLADTRLLEAPWGELVQEKAGRMGRLDGQFALPLGEAFTSLDAAFRNAEAAEADGDLREAERWYRVALRIDRRDPVIPFNLGNVLDALGRGAEAALAYGQAVARDPDFAEGWLNLGHLAEAGSRPAEAETHYARALAVRPDDPDALFALAKLLTRLGRFAEATPLWDRYLGLQPAPSDLDGARRLAALCRVGTVAGRRRN